MGLLDGFFGLSQKTNKTSNSHDPEDEGVSTDLLPELELPMKDDELVRLATQWENNWNSKKGDIEERGEENKNYWLGKHHHKGEYLNKNRPLADNMIFESLETFLPLATRQNPEPMVTSDDTPEGQKLADNIQKMLVYLADILRVRLKIKKVARHWSLFYLGVMKVGWSPKNDNISLKPRLIKKLILDPDCTIDEDGYQGEYIGEYLTDTAARLASRFPKKAKEIKQMVGDKMGTKVTYTEWWTEDYVFWKLKTVILNKSKNPHWNYSEDREIINEFGTPMTIKVPGNNHFYHRKMPYVFLSVFNLGETPYDDTSLIEQNLALQDMINKRLKQIDKNIDNMNSGVVVSGDHFTEEQATRVAAKLRNGGVIWIPKGSVRDAYVRDNPPSIPNDAYQSLIDYRSEMRNIFGTKGTTPAGIQKEKTVRGKIISAGMDTDRHGGGITEYLEQFADEVYNWFVQLMYVYYTEPHSAAVLGDFKAKEYITLQNSELNKKLAVSVKEGSMLPKDDMSKRNEAVDLWSGGAIDPISLYDRLEFPDPTNQAMRLYLWQNAPQLLFGQEGMGLPPTIQQQQQAQAQAQQASKNAPPAQQGGQPAPAQGQQQPAQNIESQILQQVPIQR